MRTLLSILTLLSLLAPSALAAPRTEERTYVASVATMCARGAQPLDVGSACFPLRADDAGRPLILTMRDLALGDVAAAYWIQQGSVVIERATFCGEASTVVPQGATLVIVFHALDQAEPLACAAPVSGAGTITMTVR